MNTDDDIASSPAARAWLAASQRAGRYKDAALRSTLIGAGCMVAWPATILAGWLTVGRWILIAAAVATAVTQVMVVLAVRHEPDPQGTTVRLPARQAVLAALAGAVAAAMLVVAVATTTWWWVPPFLIASTIAMVTAIADKR